MYEERLGTDWEDISGEEAISRAYALGVAASFGYENREEFTRLRDSIDSSYDRSIIELAYQEGKQEAAVVRSEHEDDADDESVWDHLVEGGVPPGPLDARDDPATEMSPAGQSIGATDFPAALERAGLLDGGEDLGSLGFPSALGRPNSRENDSSEER
ncbi:hypothetical protein [Halobaculum limi]|uniref:hypothetical protein n=1 Tax=Halobaculum limi TaxID=3031916 RepID=UPI002404BD61|nr:hypothetical protein [Halobaculum sp. YSMS11]